VFLIGLTGGIASGKSTVARLLQAKGARVIDADEVAREVVEPGSEGLEKVTQAFGSEVLNADGSLSREQLARVVFSDPAKRLELEAILHPLIKIRTLSLIQESVEDVVVYAVPLLVEAKVDYPFDMVVTVEAGVENQIKRMVSARFLSETDARARIAAQASSEERVARADVVIDSSGPIEQLSPQVDQLWKAIQSKIQGQN
jgi:dephospho-CoA kinase